MRGCFFFFKVITARKNTSCDISEYIPKFSEIFNFVLDIAPESVKYIDRLEAGEDTSETIGQA